MKLGFHEWLNTIIFIKINNYIAMLCDMIVTAVLDIVYDRRRSKVDSNGLFSHNHKS